MRPIPRSTSTSAAPGPSTRPVNQKHDRHPGSPASGTNRTPSASSPTATRRSTGPGTAEPQRRRHEQHHPAGLRTWHFRDRARRRHCRRSDRTQYHDHQQSLRRSPKLGRQGIRIEAAASSMPIPDDVRLTRTWRSRRAGQRIFEIGRSPDRRIDFDEIPHRAHFSAQPVHSDKSCEHQRIRRRSPPIWRGRNTLAGAARLPARRSPAAVCTKPAALPRSRRCRCSRPTVA